MTGARGVPLLQAMLAKAQAVGALAADPDPRWAALGARDARADTTLEPDRQLAYRSCCRASYMLWVIFGLITKESICEQ
jgi:hypothetical protein